MIARENPSPGLFSLMDGDNDTPPIGVLQNDMATFLPGKNEKPDSSSTFMAFSALTGSNLNCLNPHKLSQLVRFGWLIDLKVE